MFRKLFNINVLVGMVLAFMLIMPSEYAMIKLSLLLYAIIVSLFKGRIHTNVILIRWTMIYMLGNGIAFMIGVLSNNPAPLKYVNTYFIWPTLYMLVFSSLNLSFYESFHTIIKYATYIALFLGFFACVYFNLNLMIEGEFLGIKPSTRPGFPILTPSNGCVDSMIFLYSYLVIYSLHKSSYNFILLFLCVFFILLTSNRVMYSSLFLTLFMYYFFSKIVGNKKSYKAGRIMSVMIIGLVGVLIILQTCNLFSLPDLFNFFSEISESSDSYRIEQYVSLIRGWENAPLFGNGTGIDASVSRSLVPGTYELTYVALLFERGLFGFLLYIGLLIYLNIRSLRVAKANPFLQQHILPLLVAVDMVLIANVTNNYTLCFDYIWLLLILFPLIKNLKYEYMYRN